MIVSVEPRPNVTVGCGPPARMRSIPGSSVVVVGERSTLRVGRGFYVNAFLQIVSFTLEEVDVGCVGVLDRKTRRTPATAPRTMSGHRWPAPRVHKFPAPRRLETRKHPPNCQAETSPYILYLVSAPSIHAAQPLDTRQQSDDLLKQEHAAAADQTRIIAGGLIFISTVQPIAWAG
jgi:hypothetical protein